MNKFSKTKFFQKTFFLFLITLFQKIPFFLTKHIQEDSFITWRVARNVLKYGVIGFNSTEKISASTTHLYVFVSAIFQFLFGENFIYPLLIFNGFLFFISTYFLALLFFPKQPVNICIFVVLTNMLPSALMSSCLGMEYGLLLFLYSGLIYFGFALKKKWAMLLFPILIIWTRLDAAIFVGVFFLADWYNNKKFNFTLAFGGFVGFVTVVGFNYLYFGELVNHTIIAKKLAYQNVPELSIKDFFLQMAYYGGLIKMYGTISLLAFVVFFICVMFALYSIVKNEIISRLAKTIVFALFAYAIAKLLLFVSMKAYFDWYYWIPRTVFCIIIIVAILAKFNSKKSFVFLFSGVFLFYGIQIMQSYAIGFMETFQRTQIALDIKKTQASEHESILLEPAGKIPFYTGLYTYDEVGLVNKKITEEMQSDFKKFWINSVKKYSPNYILTIKEKAGAINSIYEMNPEEKAYFDSNYTIIREYPIDETRKNAPLIIKKIYNFRPIGHDYFLYRLKK